MQGLGSRVQGQGFTGLGSWSRVWGFRVWGSGFSVQGSGIRDSELGIRYYDLGFRSKALVFWVQG